jgi:Ca2+-transporting ATPase
VVGDASDVAKETADLVLLDSNFATIVAAIEEGRGIFDNLRKIILYLMSDAFSEIVAVLGSLILGLPLPVSAAQILWINLISDGFPDLALTVDPKTKGLMERPPRSPKEEVISPWMKLLILIVSATGGIIALFLFLVFLKVTGNLILARSIAFATLGVNSLVYVFSIKGLTRPFWQDNLLANKWLNIAVVGGLFLQVLPFVFPFLGRFLQVTYLQPAHWLLVFLASAIMFIIIEVAKVFFRRHIEWFQH